MLKITKSKVKAFVPSIIGKELQVRGDVLGEGALEVRGRVDGNIRCVSVVIAEGAVVCGNIAADKVEISGQVNGDIKARTINCAATAKISGNIVHQSLHIEEGAVVEGICKKFMDDQDHADLPAEQESEKVKKVEFKKKIPSSS